MEALRAELVEAASLPGLTHIFPGILRNFLLAYELTANPQLPSAAGPPPANGSGLGQGRGRGSSGLSTRRSPPAASRPTRRPTSPRRRSTARATTGSTGAAPAISALGPSAHSFAPGRGEPVLEPPQPGRLAGGARPGRIPHRRARSPRSPPTAPWRNSSCGSAPRRVSIWTGSPPATARPSSRRIGRSSPVGKPAALVRREVRRELRPELPGERHRAPGAAGPDPLRARARPTRWRAKWISPRSPRRTAA